MDSFFNNEQTWRISYEPNQMSIDSSKIVQTTGFW